jgi:hypothetical protein
MLLVASKVASPERGGKILGCTRQNRPTRFSHSAGSSSLSFAQTDVSKSLPSLNAWVPPHLGDKLLSEVANKALRELVQKMSAAGLSGKTIASYVQLAKLVVASGEQIHPRTWNHDFIQLPVVQKEKQHSPRSPQTM